MRRWSQRISGLGASAAALVAAALVGWVAVSVTVAVLSRYYFRQPLAWTIELSEYSLLFITFLALAAVARNGEHITVTILNSDNAPRATRWLDIFVHCLGALLALAFFVASALITYDSFAVGVRMSRILPIDRWVILIALPIGSLLLFIEHARVTIGHLARAYRRGPPEDPTPMSRG